MAGRNVIVSLIERCSRYPRAVFAAGVLLALLAGALSAARLGVTTDIDGLFASSLPWKQREAALKRAFPQFNNLIVVVVSGRTPEEADLTAAALAARLAPDRQHIQSVRRPDALPFYTREGLLFLPTAELNPLLDHMIDAQPFLGQLVADPSARGLFAALSLLAMGIEHGQARLGPFDPALRQFHVALADAAAGRFAPLSWEMLLAAPVAQLAGPYRFVLVQPRLDYGALAPGAAATAAIRRVAAALPAVRAGRAEIHLTGSVPLTDEEFASSAQGALAALIGSIVLVTLWLFLAVRSWRLLLPIVLNLLLGLALTTGLATLLVGTLNLISMAFAVLFVGIAVDFAIQFTVRFREMRLVTPDIHGALVATGSRAGVQVLVAAAATAAGFLAFVPTSFRGVAELGLIAGIGMLVAFICTVTFLPAALTLFRPAGEQAEVGFRWGAPLDRAIRRARWPIVAAFLAAGLLGAALLPRLTFDPDTLHTKNPNSEAMRMLGALSGNPLTNPFTIDILTSSEPAAAALAARLAKLPLVAAAQSLQSFVPQDQPAKLAMIADAANLLDPTLAAAPMGSPVTPADLRLALAGTGQQIEHALSRLPRGNALAPIAADLARLRGAPDATLLAMNAGLTVFLPMQLARLRLALHPQPVTLATLPPELVRDWVLPDGRAKVQLVPAAEVLTRDELYAFVAEAEAVAPDAGGPAVSIVATSRTVVTAFEHAAIGAVLMIAAILLLVLRRPVDAGLVLLPLLLSAALTVLAAVFVGFRMNFANIIALPLLLGVGVSFNIYFVMNWRAGEMSRIASPTARAVMFSALTTGTAFASLALSRHPGTASMGRLLLLSLGCTLLTTIFFIPALLALLPLPHPHRALRARPGEDGVETSRLEPPRPASLG